MRYSPTYLAFAVLMLLSSCAPWQEVQADGIDVPLQADEVDEIKSDLTTASATIDNFTAQTQQGRNLSDMTVGLFVANLLGQMARQDATLSMHLHRGGRFIEGYLSEVFQHQPEREIAAIRAMDHPGNLLVRATAAAALECLTHIPDSKEPPDQQARDRDQLIQSFAALKSLLDQLILSLP